MINHCQQSDKRTGNDNIAFQISSDMLVNHLKRNKCKYSFVIRMGLRQKWLVRCGKVNYSTTSVTQKRKKREMVSDENGRKQGIKRERVTQLHRGKFMTK